MIAGLQRIGTIPREPVNGILPYGRWMILSCFLSLFAFSLSIVASFHCSFFIVHKNISKIMTGFGLQHTTEGWIKVGIWRTHQDWAYAQLPDDAPWNDAYATEWQTYDKAWIAGSSNCVDWKLSQLGKLPDRPAKFARMVSVFIILIGTPLVLLMMSYAVYHPLCGIASSSPIEDRTGLPQRQNWPKVSLVHLITLCCLLEGFLTLILLSFLATDACSEDRVESCKLSTAGYLSILGAFTWWGSMVSLWLVAHESGSANSAPNIIDKNDENHNGDQGSTESSDDENADEEQQVTSFEDKLPDDGART